MTVRCLELFCGLGGCAAALDGRAEVVAAVDISELAVSVYRHNFPEHPVEIRAIGALTPERFRAWNADLWWMSPPCQPFTQRGAQRDLDDPRAVAFRALLERLVEVRPRYLAFENVPGFEGSRGHAMLREALAHGGYGAVEERLVCPSELGVPNRRRRFYLVASRGELAAVRWPGAIEHRRLADYVDPGADTDAALHVEPELVERYAGALDIINRHDPHALTACFTSAYGRSPVRSGSYLRTASAVRRFSPREILRLLGFPERFALPDGLTLRQGWRLAGNSLALAAVRVMLTAIPELRCRV